MDGWNTRPSFWGPAIFQVRSVNIDFTLLLERVCILWLHEFPISSWMTKRTNDLDDMQVFTEIACKLFEVHSDTLVVNGW